MIYYKYDELIISLGPGRGRSRPDGPGAHAGSGGATQDARGHDKARPAVATDGQAGFCPGS